MSRPSIIFIFKLAYQTTLPDKVVGDILSFRQPLKTMNAHFCRCLCMLANLTNFCQQNVSQTAKKGKEDVKEQRKREKGRKRK